MIADLKWLGLIGTKGRTSVGRADRTGRASAEIFTRRYAEKLGTATQYPCFSHGRGIGGDEG